MVRETRRPRADQRAQEKGYFAEQDLKSTVSAQRGRPGPNPPKMVAAGKRATSRFFLFMTKDPQTI